MASVVSNHHQPATSAHDHELRKRKNESHPSPSMAEQQRDRAGHEMWRSDKQQQIYSTKLAQALTKIHIRSAAAASSPVTPRRGRAVREAADRALAMAARGRTLWSRAILTSRSVKLKFTKHKRTRSVPVAITKNGRSRKPRVSVMRLRGKSLPAVQRKAKMLGRLVPGCRKQPLPVILEEATDYIAAMEMQVRTMSALAELLCGGHSSAAPQPSV